MLRYRRPRLLVVFKLGFIPFAATDHFDLVGRWGNRRRSFYRCFVELRFRFGRWHRRLAQVQRAAAGRADAALFCVQRITQRELNPSLLRNQRQLLRVVRGNQECNHGSGLRVGARVAVQALADGDDRDIFEDGGGLTIVPSALISCGEHIHAGSRLNEAGHGNYVIDTYGNGAHSWRDH